MPLENIVVAVGIFRAMPGVCRDPETMHAFALVEKALVQQVNGANDMG
jgi:hypothetical protein